MRCDVKLLSLLLLNLILVNLVNSIIYKEISQNKNNNIINIYRKR